EHLPVLPCRQPLLGDVAHQLYERMDPLAMKRRLHDPGLPGGERLVPGRGGPSPHPPGARPPAAPLLIQPAGGQPGRYGGGVADLVERRARERHADDVTVPRAPVDQAAEHVSTQAGQLDEDAERRRTGGLLHATPASCYGTVRRPWYDFRLVNDAHHNTIRD